MSEKKVTPETILSTKPNLDKDNVIEAMQEYAGIKILEAVLLLSMNFSIFEKVKVMKNIDDVVDKVLNIN